MRPLYALLSFGLLAGVGPAGAQTFNYVLSSCASGVTMQVNLPVSMEIPQQGPNGGYAFNYLSLSETLTLTINGASQIDTGPGGAVVLYTPATGPGSYALTAVGFNPPVGGSSSSSPDWSVSPGARAPCYRMA